MIATRLACITAGVLLASSCSADVDDTATTTSVLDAPLVLVQYSTSTIGGPGGPVPEDLPELTVYDDGSVVLRDPAAAAGPIPGLLESTVDTTEVDRLLAEAREAGLFEATDLGGGGFEPLPTTVILRDGSTSHRFEVAGLDGPDADGLTGEQSAARSATRSLRDRLLALTVGHASAYAPTGLAAFASPRAPGARPVLDWPADRPLDQGDQSDGTHERCLLLTGDDLETVTETAGDADTDRWASGGDNWIVNLRPLLPHEHACPTTD